MNCRRVYSELDAAKARSEVRSSLGTEQPALSLPHH
jgi:hypothetical protein